MKTAILSCIHGNLQALEAVDADIASIGVDRTYCLGDIVGYGAQPRECVALVRARGWPTLIGNHEATVLDPTHAESYNPYAKCAIYFTMGALGEDERAWFRTLPETIETDGFQLVHGSPAGRRVFQYVVSQEDAELALTAATRPLAFIGHTHRPIGFYGTEPLSLSSERCQHVDPAVKTVINVGSVGQPRDRDPRACWALYDDVARTVEYRRVVYDHADATRRIIAAGLPPVLGERLAGGN